MDPPSLSLPCLYSDVATIANQCNRGSLISLLAKIGNVSPSVDFHTHVQGVPSDVVEGVCHS
eukprot:1928302-Pyramimonas_sp.AAC.1